MSNAINSVGTVFKRWGGSDWVSVAEIKAISGPGMTRDMIDVTSLDTIGGYREFIPGFRNGGTVGLTMNFTRAGWDIMHTDFESDVIQNYEFILPDADLTAIEFEGLIVEMPLSVAVGDAVGVEIKIQITSAPVITSGGLLPPA